MEVIGNAVSAIATAYAAIYITAIVAKTFLIYTEKLTDEKQIKEWFNFWNKRGM